MPLARSASVACRYFPYHLRGLRHHTLYQRAKMLTHHAPVSLAVCPEVGDDRFGILHLRWGKPSPEPEPLCGLRPPLLRGHPATPLELERGCRRALSRRAFCPAPKGAVLHTQGPARTLNRRAFPITRRPGKPTGPGFPPARAWIRLPPPSGCGLLFRQSRWSLARQSGNSGDERVRVWRASP